MSRALMIEALDAEILKLKQAKVLIQGTKGLGPALAKMVASGGLGKQSSHRNITPEGRKRIADAQRRRWAKQKAGK